jgi:hypothetical protein
MPRRERALLALYGALALLVIPVFPHFLSPNEFTRWAAAASLAERGTPEISTIRPLLGPSFEDVAAAGGRLYSNKAPGLAFVALPGYLLARPIAGPPSREAMRIGLDAMRLLGATLPTLLLATVAARTATRLGAERERVPVVVFALLFATPLFAYGLLLFSHALVAAALFGAWAALFLPVPARAAARRDVLAGVLLGLAVLSEYPAAIPAAVLALTGSWRRGPGRLVRIAAGGAPFALALLVYNRICFGGFFELSSAHEAEKSFRALASSGLFGIGLPSPAALARLVADPSKGLLLFSPFVVLALRALPAVSGCVGRPATVALSLVPLSMLLLFAGYPNWHGGFTVGPRYLVGALPFLVFPLAFRGGGRLEAVLLGASAGAVSLTALVFPFVPGGFALPWGSFSLPLLSHGLVAPNFLHLMPGGAAAVALPFAVVGAAAAVVFGRRRLLPAVLGAALWIGAGAALEALVPPGPRERLVRAYVADVYFGRRGTLEREIAATGVAQPRLLSRRNVEETIGPTPWPF